MFPIYVLHGKNVVHLTQGSNNLHFFYGADGSPAIVEYNGVSYGYVKNLQGDVIGIVNASGAYVVQYAYDAWGRLLSKTGSMASTLGTLNPFRYRGYVYDEETGLYYLRSRYFNPTWCRFVNADSVLEMGKGYLGGNQFMYSLNTPIGRIDEAGTSSIAAPVWEFVKQNGAQVSMSDGLLPVGDVVVLGTCAVGCFLSIIDFGVNLYNSIMNPPVTVVELSKKIDWNVENNQHILKGSKPNGGHDWSPFGIGPNDSNKWEKLVPLLKTVADQGQRWTNPRETKPIPNVEYYVYYFEEYSHAIVLKLFNRGDFYSISDAFPLR